MREEAGQARAAPWGIQYLEVRGMRRNQQRRQRRRDQRNEENQESVVLKIKEEGLRSELGTGFSKMEVIDHFDISVEDGMS